MTGLLVLIAWPGSIDPRNRREQLTNGRRGTEMIIAHRTDRRHRFDAGVFMGAARSRAIEALAHF
jgi:hypothetical protein